MSAAITVDGFMRSEASYRISFQGSLGDFGVDIGARVNDIVREMPPVEIRILPDEIVAYVMIPSDVMPEALDAKAKKLREAWAAREKETTDAR